MVEHAGLTEMISSTASSYRSESKRLDPSWELRTLSAVRASLKGLETQKEKSAVLLRQTKMELIPFPWKNSKQ